MLCYIPADAQNKTHSQSVKLNKIGAKFGGLGVELQPVRLYLAPPPLVSFLVPKTKIATAKKGQLEASKP